MVEVTEDYGFTAADGSTKTLLDLFEGRHQLIVDHYMFDPDWEDGCMSCAARVDQFGNIAHLHERDTTIAVVSRARSASEWEARGMPAPQGELHGTSVFLRDGGRVFHTYSAYGRGTEQVGGTHYYLDMTALGRQQDWEERKGRAQALRPRADQPGAGLTADRR
jgi:predicted dithiol-disulfide oxidoreductase (DUF899 family)